MSIRPAALAIGTSPDATVVTITPDPITATAAHFVNACAACRSRLIALDFIYFSSSWSIPQVV